MKFLFLLIYLTFNLISCSTAQDLYLFNQGKKFDLTVNNSKFYTTFNIEEIEELI